jgi:hypothetical protein
MPSSLVFAALTLAWIVVLVPMVARRRQEVRRTADSALAARVVRRGNAREFWPEEVPDMPEDSEDRIGNDSIGNDRIGDQPRGERRYRPGRGGFDPEAAALAARTRYAFRQRVVFFLLLAAVATGLFAGFALPVVWWAHGALDVLLVGYLVYLRRQVRIEQEIRQRRLDRATRVRRAAGAPRQDADSDSAEPPESPTSPQRLPQRGIPRGAAVVDLDDEDPGLCDLESQVSTPYRRAVGE